VSIILPNGLRVQILLNEKLITKRPTLLCQFLVASGAAADPAGKKGLAHTLEHIVCGMTPELPRLFSEPLRDAFQKRQVVYPLPRTELDYTRMSIVAPAALHRDVFDFLGRWISEPKLDEAYVAACVRDVIEEKRGQLRDNPFTEVYDVLYESAFSGHPYEAYTVGRIGDLETITRQDCEQFFRRHYGLANVHLTVMLSADAKPDFDRIADSARERFALLPGVGDPPRPLPSRTLLSAGFRLRRLKATAAQRAAVIGLATPALKDLDSASHQLVRFLLCAPGSRLREQLSPWVKTLIAVPPLTREPGLFEVLAEAQAGAGDDWQEALRAGFFAEARRIASGALDEDEFELAQALAARHWEKTQERPEQQMEMLAVHELFGRGQAQWLEQPEKIGSMDAEALSRAASEWMKEDAAVAVMT
jgi:zinc protease